MDKRTILFIALITVAFFGLNVYFSRYNEEQARAERKEQEALTLKKREAIRAETEKKIAPVSALPIVEITSDKEGTTKIGYGLNVLGNTLTLGWEKPQPDSVFIKGQEQKLVTCEAVLDSPVVYAPKSFKQLEIASVPNVGIYELQLITLSKNSPLTVSFGQYHDGVLELPLGPLDQNAIVLFKTDQGYLPFGYYEKKSGQFVELQNLPLLACLTLHISPTEKIPTEASTAAKYYVLENNYLQLVFSSVGGALAEINLPFESNTNQKSVVKEIGFDREIISDYPANAHFPAHSYFTANSKEEKGEGAVGGYYPLLRRGIFGKKPFSISPEYFALNIVSEYPELAHLSYTVKEFTDNTIVFEASLPHRKITKTYTLNKDGAPYSFDLSIKIEGDSRGLFLTTGIPEVELMSNSSTPQIQYRLTRKGKADVQKLDLPKPSEVITMSSINPDWVVNSNGYMGLILTPLNDPMMGFRARGILGNQVPTRLSAINPEHAPYPASNYNGYEMLIPLPNQAATSTWRVFAGPFDESILKAIDRQFTDPKTGQNPNYTASWTFYGWLAFLTEPFAKFLFIVMKFFHSLTCSWAAAIILLTVFLRILLYPLNAWSIKSMQRMREVTPEVQAIQKKYKKEPKKAQIEIMALYREKKVNPMSGCFPILVQIPFLIAMFDLLKSSFQLRGASFIPGWIDNLTAPDVLFSWSRPIFFIGTEFHLLPIILGAVMLLQQRISAPAKGAVMTDQERQQRTMSTMMAVVFTVMFYNFPSGLNIYWLSSMLLGILQQWISTRAPKKKTNNPTLPVRGKDSK